MFSKEDKLKLMNSLPNHLRESVQNFRLMVAQADSMLDHGEVSDAQLANFFVLLHITMTENMNHPNMSEY